MGDVYEFTTWSKHQTLFYKINNNALVFNIKGERNAAIGLAKHPGECEYWILIGVDQQCWIKKNNGRCCCSVSTQNILSRDKYKKFWITLKRGEISLGKSNKKNPILSQQTSIENLQYVTFSVVGERNHLQWKLHLPPQIQKPTLVRLTGGEPQWIKANEQLPDGALIGGHENGVLYIIRAPHRGSLTPGKFVPELGLGFVSWGCEMHEKSDFEVLCGYNCTWVKTVKNKIPVGAVEGGYSEDGHEILYVGRAFYDNHLIPGKVQPSHNCCYIPYQEKEIGVQTYEILVFPDQMTHSANKFYVSGLGIRNYMQNYSYDSERSPEEYSEEDENDIW
ncbi:unnamed protein product [Euphydryas editha]|uniref:Farnesoic acid O-methyl transferase domain-containing protein n=1 Tax=Euphydryas editha TaxID=104508 RepID=A0AAU9UUJ4_EUPED|nr:unnamed protein product [Euphydryas editha]